MVQMAGAYPRFLNMKHALEYCYSPLDGILVCRRFTPPPPSAFSENAHGKCTFLHMHHFKNSMKKLNKMSRASLFLPIKTTNTSKKLSWLATKH